jgi:hypothetical protein
MADTEYGIERRARMLAGRIVSQKDLIVNALRPKGQRPPFTEQVSEAEALAFWKQHRYDGTGKRVLAAMKPADIMELDMALQSANEGTNGQPAQGSGI